MKFGFSFTLFFLLFTFITISDCQAVVDIQHENLFEGYRYKIISANQENNNFKYGGGVRLGKTGDLNCPVTVLQSYKDADKGFQVQLIIIEINIGIVTAEHHLEIRFEPQDVPKCAEDAKWVVYVDNTTKKSFVGIGGPENYPGKQILNGTFGIREYKKHYKLVFCVKGSSNCSDIGRFDNHEAGRLLNIPNNEPWEVAFVRTH